MDEREAKRISDAITKKLEYWKETTVNIAVVGRSGAGKSSFINTIRGLYADDEGAAGVGCNQTTMVEGSYAFPGNSKLRLRDLPGMGTTEFPRENYLEIFDKDQNDCFVIISQSRFSDDDVWLAEQITEMGKKFYFVRSHIDDDISNEKYETRNQITEEEVLTKIEKTIKENLPETNKCIDIYLIDCLDSAKYDFPKLKKDIINNFPSYKQEAMIRAIKATGELIEKKAQLFRMDIFCLSVKSAVNFAIRPPDCDGLQDNEDFLLSTAMHYISELGLDESAVEALRRRGPVTFQSFSEVLRESDRSVNEGGLGGIVHNVGQIILPAGGFFQRIRSGFTTFRCNSKRLEETLSSLEKAAKNELKNVLDKLEGEFFESEEETETPFYTDPTTDEEPYFN